MHIAVDLRLLCILILFLVINHFSACDLQSSGGGENLVVIAGIDNNKMKCLPLSAAIDVAKIDCTVVN
jgi:hypothetical protein